MESVNVTLTRTYVATDECDNEATWVQIFTYKVDILAPVITPTGAGGDLGCNPTAGEISDALGTATATDNCDASVDVTTTPGDPVNTDGCNWSQSVTFTATDSCDNDATPVTITVTYKLDEVDPVIVADGTGGDLGCNPTAGDITDALGSATATDNCDASVDVTTTPGAPVNTDGCNWTQSVTFTAIDSCGNEAEPVTVTVTYRLDDVDPVIVADGTGGDLGCNPTANDITDALGSATATDNCDASVDVTATPGAPVNTDGCNWTQSVTFTATESCGNDAEPVTITVNYRLDDIDPVIDATGTGGDLGCNPTAGDIADALGTATATDNCDASVDVTATPGAPVNTDGCNWSQSVTFTATDSCGNDAESVTVTVTYKLDDIAPVIDATGISGDLGCNPTAGDITDALGTATATDNCDASVDVTTTPGAPVNTDGCNWSQSVTFTAIDSCGNEATPVTITVTYKIDIEAPVITPSSTPVDLGCNPTGPQINAALGDALASDNCDASVIVDADPGTPVNTGGCNWSQSITFTATDSCGNAAEPVTVTVTYKLDDVDPVIDANGTGGDLGCNPTPGEISDALGTATASDNCDASVDVTTTPGDPVNTDGCNWSQSVTFTAIDSCGNEADAVTVTVTYKLDDVDPVIDATGTGGI